MADAAAKAGYHPAGFSLSHTLIWIAVLAAYIPYSMYSAQGLLGEVKGARSLNRLYLTFLTGGVILAIILLAVPFVLISHIAGSNFLNQYAWAYGAGLIHPTYLPNIGVFLSMLTSNPLIVTLVALGFIVGGFAIANVVFVNSARVMMAMGLDGSLPRFFSDVSGLETQQILGYAARVISLLEELDLGSVRDPFLEILSGARSNVLGMGNGAFQAPRSYPLVATTGSKLVVADFNRDGYSDVAFAQWSPAKKLSVMMNFAN